MTSMGIDSLSTRTINLICFEPNTGCWLWLGSRGAGGYAVDLHHRFIYRRLVGPIPPGMYLDHICRVRHCVAPNHLRVVTPRQNAVENNPSPVAARAAQTHCVANHPFDPANTYRRPNGTRHCRACDAARAQSARRRRKG